MLSVKWFRYETDDKNVYDMGIEYLISASRPKLIGADLYNENGEYVGYWDRSNMPLPIIREVERWLQGDPSWAAHLERSRLNRSR